ncbi:hypothetical protein HS088_TW04G00478 [Tripterygium wilfordii]|uniref:Uncharacterized protein n=1 Tax=Tripterygium wilfordii TaxID=458696 RepID=A0A7J7DQE8_TRIWF|nr:hypothetical protein HS088_TW04G00478 [Tripterygium wilfordii]
MATYGDVINIPTYDTVSSKLRVKMKSIFGSDWMTSNRYCCASANLEAIVFFFFLINNLEALVFQFQLKIRSDLDWMVPYYQSFLPTSHQGFAAVVEILFIGFLVSSRKSATMNVFFF